MGFGAVGGGQVGDDDAGAVAVGLADAELVEKRARASEIIEIIESLPRWLAPLMSVTRTVRWVL
jgi:hypothetical protein